MTAVDVEAIIREYINKSIHMSLGTSKNNRPWVSEVHFVYDDDLNLYFRSLTSRRHSQEIADNPYVAGNIVKQHTLEEPGQGIYFEGQAEHLTDASERQKVIPYFKDRLKLDEAILQDAGQPDGHHFYKITVNNWYAFGKFGQDSSNKYHLPWHKSVKGSI